MQSAWGGSPCSAKPCRPTLLVHPYHSRTYICSSSCYVRMSTGVQTSCLHCHPSGNILCVNILTYLSSWSGGQGFFWQPCCPFYGGDELLWDSPVGLGRGGAKIWERWVAGRCSHRDNERGFLPMGGPFPPGDAAGRWGLGLPWWELPSFSVLPAPQWGRLLVPRHLLPCVHPQMGRGIGALPRGAASHKGSSWQPLIAAGVWGGSWGL